MLQWIVFHIHDNSPTINNEHNSSSKYTRSPHNFYINEKKYEGKYNYNDFRKAIKKLL